MSDPPVVSPRGTWTCVEARVAANTGGEANGSQTLWIDGVQAGEWSGIRWRTDDSLKINSVGLWHYVTSDSYAAGQSEQTIWFDDVVISTMKIGCGGPPGSGGSGGSSTGGTGGSGGAGGSGASVGSGGAGASAGSGGSGASAASGESDDSGGCGCRVSPRSGIGAALFLLALGAFAASRRARRRQ
jgi:MYXO-CTERM domain-containing protein